VKIIEQILDSKHPEASTMVNTKNIANWHVCLVAKDVVKHKEFDAISN
jgi:hypothetical protein